MRNKKNSILVAGAGPVGLVSAIRLAEKGIKSCIIDKRTDRTFLPRAINISGETLSILNEIGCLDEVLSKGLMLKRINLFWNQKRISSIQGKYFQGEHPYFFHIEQSVIEQILLNKLDALGIEVKSGHELLSVSLDESSACTVIQNNQGEVFKERWSLVIACDGAQSSIREQLKFKTTQKQYDSYFVLADVKLKNYPLTQDELYYFLTEQGYVIIAPLPDKKYRVITSFKGSYPGKERIAFCKNQFENLVKQRTGIELKIGEINWDTSAPFYHRVALEASKSNVFLAGDAFHQFAPVGGTNMNMGIADAFCLADLISDNSNKVEIIKDKYEATRLQAALKNVEMTQWATEMMTQTIEIEEKEKRFISQLQQKNMLKVTLPRLFSGQLQFNQL